MAGSGWLLIPVGGMPYPTDCDELAELAEGGAFDFESRNGPYADISEHGQFAYIDSDEAPSFNDALKKLRLN
jgi:hypothetical protein